MSNYSKAHSIVGFNPEGRPKGDFYPTPVRATEALLNKESFPKRILEPACGDGAISKVLIDRGFDVTSTDLYEYDWNGGLYGWDFISHEYLYTAWDGAIITNPPFTLAQEFLQYALWKNPEKVALLCKIQFLEGVKRASFLKITPLKKVLVFKRRLKLTRNGDETLIKGGGMITFAWFIWEKGYRDAPRIDWI